MSTQILVVRLSPFFLEKTGFWFEKNFKDICQQYPNDYLLINKSQLTLLSDLVRKLLDLGYEKVQEVSFPGEFSQKGGVVDIFPVNFVNSRLAFRLEFFNNAIEEIFPLEKLEVLDEVKVRKILKAKLKSQKLFSGLKELKVGDYLVHLDHGIGKFIGLEKLSPEGPDYYVLEYAALDKLYVPLGLERKLSRYVGFTNPKISRLGSSTWQKTKKKIKEEVEKFAKELLGIYAEREIASRPPYLKDQEIESALASTFAFRETPDQTKALLDIRQDLLKTKPMDRLLCGDVGFGKTEVALRAMLMAVSSGYMSILLCPTTILANQHFQNFKQRLVSLPLNLEILTRLQSKKEQKRIVDRLILGQVDILVGTHRVLSQDVSKYLFNKGHGLLVIDDEQRFGVRQKEKLKKLRSSLDILSLSATPIPRTLYLAFSSLRQMSLIQTPPLGRLPIKTMISPWSEKKIKEVINKEITRKGQVYYLHNRVTNIENVKVFLEKLCPKAKIGIVHGRLNETKLLKTMTDFQLNKINLLLATTIIENGLDFPNVNTLIVDDASRLGLSQAYQIRGRIGRFSIPAFAFFFHPKKLSPLAQERLEALKQAQALGSGWQIAIRDLEIRGAGNILGREQSGSINQIGLNLYCQMLSEIVLRISD
ncbi:DEAD/DEAH box helicase [Candidatus Parcubacteria bacterium]|nr:DEAD/DEAH box helicase [Patescibacteria group bacterium]MCG2688255.1 DEAD/DEAH box helicase [Candidatus Parcubacteria bacterium]